MQYEKQIREVFAGFHESWMDEVDRAEFDAELMRRFGEELDEAIAEGVENGYSVEYQMRIVEGMLQRLATQ